MVTKTRPEQFKELALEMAEMYAKKNEDYGNSFGETFADVGIISAYTRISDKFNRFKHAVISGDKPHFESMEMALSDLACYALMTIIELREQTPTVPVKKKGDIAEMLKNCTPMQPPYYSPTDTSKLYRAPGSTCHVDVIEIFGFKEGK